MLDSNEVQASTDSAESQLEVKLKTVDNLSVSVLEEIVKVRLDGA